MRLSILSAAALEAGMPQLPVFSRKFVCTVTEESRQMVSMYVPGANRLTTSVQGLSVADR